MTQCCGLNAAAVKQNLEDAGCASEIIADVLTKLPELSPDEFLHLLETRRQELLYDMHVSQREYSIRAAAGRCSKG